MVEIFFLSIPEKEVMLEDIRSLKTQNHLGFFIGALTANGNLDTKTIEQQLKEIDGFPVTFHRAIDMCKNPFEAIDILASLGIEKSSPLDYTKRPSDRLVNLQKFVEISKGRIAIMAGSGVNSWQDSTIG